MCMITERGFQLSLTLTSLRNALATEVTVHVFQSLRNDLATVVIDRGFLISLTL